MYSCMYVLDKSVLLSKDINLIRYASGLSTQIFETIVDRFVYVLQYLFKVFYHSSGVADLTSTATIWQTRRRLDIRHLAITTTATTTAGRGEGGGVCLGLNMPYRHSPSVPYQGTGKGSVRDIGVGVCLGQSPYRGPLGKAPPEKGPRGGPNGP